MYRICILVLLVNTVLISCNTDNSSSENDEDFCLDWFYYYDKQMSNELNFFACEDGLYHGFKYFYADPLNEQKNNVAFLGTFDNSEFETIRKLLNKEKFDIYEADVLAQSQTETCIPDTEEPFVYSMRWFDNNSEGYPTDMRYGCWGSNPDNVETKEMLEGMSALVAQLIEKSSI